MNTDPSQDDTLGPNEAVLDAALDRTLARVWQPPAVPVGFQDRLRAALADEAALDLARQRRELEAERQEQLAALQRGYVRMKRDVLALALAVAFTAGAVMHWAMPWLRDAAGVDLDRWSPMLALLGGLLVAGAAWVQRFGWPVLPITRRWLRT
ncbi:hypothetical protein AACH06_09260 [Ideonella sp. DXS29W]|uniref:Uncharacterized protein n=1 Tax=Ideonella lacteola TaxID=2984193 RepID=A0ABU9BM19_9BURK